MNLNRLEKLLSIRIEADALGWESASADAARVAEFCEIYESKALSDREKGALMSLLIASFEEALRAGEASQRLWEKIARLLERDGELHGGVLDYWSRDGEKNRREPFLVTPLIRSVRDAVRRRL